MASSDRPGLRYYYSDGIDCESCQRLDKMEMKEQPDDDDFIDPDDDFDGNDALRLHVVNYRRTKYLNGCFDIDCPPRYGGIGGIAQSGKHFANDEDYKDTVDQCARYAVQACNDANKGGHLELVNVENVAVEGSGWRTFYMTIACRKLKWISEAGDASDRDDSVTQSYRAVVSCRYWKREDKKMVIFKDPNGNNLIKPAKPLYDRITRLPEERHKSASG